jgi:CHAT domain-containing protein
MTNRLGYTVLVALGLLAACNEDKPVVSLEQAKQITAQFQSQGFTPPPRTIADITAILDQQKPDPGKAEAARRAADSQPDTTLTGVGLAQFYFIRGNAAGDIGRIQQRVDDLSKAAEILRPLRHILLGDVLQRLSQAQMRAGQIKSAVATSQEQIQFLGSMQRNSGKMFSSYSNIISVSAGLGDVDGANAWLGRMERLLGDARTWQRGADFPIYGNSWSANTAQARGMLLESTGKFADAERQFREAERQFAEATQKEPSWPDRLPPGTLENGIYSMSNFVGRTLLRQGRVVEAEVEVRKSLLGMLKLRGRYASETADVLSLLTVILVEQGRFSEAEKLARATIDIYENTGHGVNSTRLAQARLQLAQIETTVGNYDAALALYDRVDRDLTQYNPDFRATMLGTNISYAIALQQTGRIDSALTVLQAARDANAKMLGEHHRNTAEARGFLAAAFARKGDGAAALREFQTAVPTLMARSRDVEEEGGGSAGKDRRLQIILEAYIRTLAEGNSPNAAEEAFRIADAIRGQSVQRALAASSARAAASDPALAELVRQEQDAQKQVASLQEVLTNALASPADQQDAAALRTLRTQIDSLRTARARIREDIEKRFPDYVNLIDPRPATVEQARASLRPGEALIATYVGAERTFVWAVPQQGPVAYAAVDMNRRAVGQAVTQLRQALDPNATTLGDIPAFDVALAHKLYAALLQPVEAGWKDAKSLLVVPHGALGQLPFAVLVTAPMQVQPDREGQALFAGYKSVPFLAKRAAITQLPSVASLASLRALPAPKGERQAFIGFGDPWFSPEQAADAQRETQLAQLQTRGAQTLVATRGVKLVRRNAPTTQSVDSAELGLLPRLPDTADEVRAIALALNADPTKDVFTGREANERRVRSMDLSNRKVVMFATHGLIPGDLNGLTQPALALSAPNVADIDGDGLLTLDEILALRLNADWVVLSACNTATGEGAGAEAVSGLGRAFFYAGTRALLVSNWPVETNSAKALTTDLFRRQAQNAQLSRAELLRQTEVAMIDGPGYVDPASKAAVFAYAHPIFWAPFSLVGDGGGGTPGS